MRIPICIVKCHFFWARLADWMEKVIEPNGIVDYIVKFSYRMYTDTKQLARLKSGFLLKEILEHFSQKANSTLSPDRSLWLYSAHDYTVSNMLNSLGLFEVSFFFGKKKTFFFISSSIFIQVLNLYSKCK